MKKKTIKPEGIDHSQDSVGDAFGVKEDRIKEIILKANERLTEMREAGEDITTSKMIEIGLELSDTINEGIMMIFALGSQEGMINALKMQQSEGLLKALMGDHKPMGPSVPGESKEV